MGVVSALPLSPPPTSPCKESTSPAQLRKRVHSNPFAQPRETIASARLDSPADSPLRFPDIVDRKRRKRVKFVNEHDLDLPAMDGTPGNSTRIAFQSCDRRSSTRSILKQTSSPIRLMQQFVVPSTLSETVGSTLKQLAQKDFTARLDAYNRLAGAFSQHDLQDLDCTALKVQLHSLCRHLRGEMEALSSFDLREPKDQNFHTATLKLCNSLISNLHLSQHLTEDFRGFLLDHSLASLSSRRTKKTVIPYLRLLSAQRFGKTLRKDDRGQRLLQVLEHTRRNHNSATVTALMLMTYTRLLSQIPQTMKDNLRWLEHSLQMLKSNVQYVRRWATSVCAKAAAVFGSSNSINSAPTSFLETEDDVDLLVASQIALELDFYVSAGYGRTPPLDISTPIHT